MVDHCTTAIGTILKKSLGALQFRTPISNGQELLKALSTPELGIKELESMVLTQTIFDPFLEHLEVSGYKIEIPTESFLRAAQKYLSRMNEADSNGLYWATAITLLGPDYKSVEAGRKELSEDQASGIATILSSRTCSDSVLRLLVDKVVDSTPLSGRSVYAILKALDERKPTQADPEFRVRDTREALIKLALFIRIAKDAIVLSKTD